MSLFDLEGLLVAGWFPIYLNPRDPSPLRPRATQPDDAIHLVARAFQNRLDAPVVQVLDPSGYALLICLVGDGLAEIHTLDVSRHEDVDPGSILHWLPPDDAAVDRCCGHEKTGYAGMDSDHD
jgi:hypothetical protein